MLIEDLARFAAEEQSRFDACTSAKVRKERGHFGTPAAIADFMSGMFANIPQGAVRVLDPGAGVGILSASICQRILDAGEHRELEFELWENDRTLERHLCRVMDHCQKALRRAGHVMSYAIRFEDFVLAKSRRTFFDEGPTTSFNLAILNPPYFKVRKESEQAKAMEHVVRGQPNIYAFFMAVAADQLMPGGEMVAITPRSYFNGPYFKRFRKWFFDRMTARQIHCFESRTEAFSDDDVLQENVILRAEKCQNPTHVVLSSTKGRKFGDVNRLNIPYERVIETSSGDHVIRVTTNRFESRVVETMDRLPRRFRDLELEVSTGPVVTFRAADYLRQERSSETAPLLYMHNVRPFVTRFLPKSGKPSHILVSEESKRLLVPAKRYVLLKRFTAKEEKRRLVAGIMKAKDSYCEWVGLENHLNYIYRKEAELSKAEAYGLAAFLNSSLVDRYFRAVSGNTQVNATEIRSMPVPSIEQLSEIGDAVRQMPERDLNVVGRVVGNVLGLPGYFLEQLHEFAK
jgi:adenine-specific DNA-methyltransferase